MTNIYIELFGYLGSTLVVVSMLMASVVKLRVINMIGSVISASYALIIGSFPLVLMNVCLIAINAYNLVRLLKVKNHCDLLEAEADDGFAAYFLGRYEADIRHYFPDFLAQAAHGKAYITCCNGIPAGVVLGSAAGSELKISLDYTTPTYRDCSVAAFLYPALKEKGFDTLRFTGACSQQHAAYLAKMGFAAQGGGYVKKLP